MMDLEKIPLGWRKNTTDEPHSINDLYLLIEIYKFIEANLQKTQNQLTSITKPNLIRSICSFRFIY